ncbi:MAG TPA: outer membrane beta-barrel protein [Burkholderiales bacterium]|nr:outer membrane beta-barrel protein [Burkholderiales bacterium]
MLRTLAIAAGALLAVPVFAQETGFYAGGHFGQASYRNTCDELGGSGITCDDSDTGFRILGGYQLNRSFALELAYTDLGEVSASGGGGTASAEASAFEVVAVGTLPLAERFSLYGKAGVYRGEVDARIDTVLVSGSASESNTDLTFGAGVRFDFSPRAALRVEWQRYPDMGGDETGEDDIDFLSVGVIFRF